MMICSTYRCHKKQLIGNVCAKDKNIFYMKFYDRDPHKICWNWNFFSNPFPILSTAYRHFLAIYSYQCVRVSFLLKLYTSIFIFYFIDIDESMKRYMVYRMEYYVLYALWYMQIIIASHFAKVDTSNIFVANSVCIIESFSLLYLLYGYIPIYAGSK